MSAPNLAGLLALRQNATHTHMLHTHPHPHPHPPPHPPPHTHTHTHARPHTHSLFSLKCYKQHYPPFLSFHSLILMSHLYNSKSHQHTSESAFEMMSLTESAAK